MADSLSNVPKWLELDQANSGAQNSIWDSHVSDGDQGLESPPAAPRLHRSRKLESGEEPELTPGHSDTG